MTDDLLAILLAAIMLAPLGIFTLIAYLKTDRKETKRLAERYLKAVDKIEREKYDSFSYREEDEKKFKPFKAEDPKEPFNQSVLLRTLGEELEEEEN